MKLNEWDIRDRVRVQVREGGIAISSIWVSVATDSLIIVDIDCKSKYPVIGPMSSSEIYLIANEETLFARNSDAATIISLDLPDGFRIGPVESGRYSVALFCHRSDAREQGPSVLIWEPT